VNVLTILKAYSVSHPFSVTLRSNIAKLTQSTQDFAILLQVSSFSPAPTPGPYSPAVGGLSPNPGKLSSGGISRSRSAQASQTSSSVKPKPGELRDTPWSALPHQTFKIDADS
jgi:RAM signalling pathway protein